MTIMTEPKFVCLFLPAVDIFQDKTLFAIKKFTLSNILTIFAAYYCFHNIHDMAT